LNDVSVHASVGTSTSYRERISGRAIVTTDESASTIPTATTRSAVRRRVVSGLRMPGT
jgi:hypothetical protein